MIMRRVNSQRSYKSSRNNSPSDSFNGQSFRRSQRRKGKSLMRRTQLSWQKLNQHHFNKDSTQSIQNKAKQKINEYLLSTQKLQQPNSYALGSDKRMSPKNDKPTFRQRVKFLRKSKDNSNRFQTQLSIKMSDFQMPPSRKSRQKKAKPVNQILTVKSLKSLNTTDSNNKRESGDSADSQAYASFYQMNQILQNACERQPSRSRANKRVVCQKIPEQSTYQQYQLFNKNCKETVLSKNSPNTASYRSKMKSPNYFPTEQAQGQDNVYYKIKNRQKFQNNSGTLQRQSIKIKNKKMVSTRGKMQGPPTNHTESLYKNNNIIKHKKSNGSRNTSRSSRRNYDNFAKQPLRKRESKLLQSKVSQNNYNEDQGKLKNQSSPYQGSLQNYSRQRQNKNPDKNALRKQKKVQAVKKSLGMDLPLYSRNNSILNTTNLMSLSQMHKNQNPADNIMAKISVHLQIIGELAEYCKGMIQMYEQLDDWEQLIFLMYKKYYIERKKVINLLKSTIGQKNSNKQFGIPENPFVISSCKVSLGQLAILPTKKQNELIKLIQQNQNENKLILDSMRNFYNIIIDKSGLPHINIDNQTDNFDNYIYKDIKMEINLLQQMFANYPSKPIKNRLKQVYKTVFLISQLDHQFIIGYEESLQDDDESSYLAQGNSETYLNKAKFLFNKYLALPIL